MSGQPAPDGAPPIEFKPPLRTHRGLFVALCVVFALWVAVLIGIYLKTVYPMRHAAHAPAASRAV